MEDKRQDFDDGVYIEDKDGIVTVHNLDKVSYRAQINNLSDKVMGYYKELKALLLSYKCVTERVYIGKDSYFIGADAVAKFNIVDNQLYFYIKINPADVGRTDCFCTPQHQINAELVFTMFNINTEVVFKQACSLINVLMNKYEGNS